MSGQPQEKPVAADMGSADTAAAQAQPPRDDRRPEAPQNVRKLERSGRPEVERGHAESERPGALLPGDEAGELRRRWDAIQTSFVDEPRHAVEEANDLVAQAMKRLAEVFAQERSNLEQQWSRGEDVSTEDFRVALKRYRSFFDRLLSV
jgi:hypothetical protein